MRSLQHHSLQTNDNNFIYDHAKKLLSHVHEHLMKDKMVWKWENDLLFLVSYFLTYKLYMDDRITARQLRRLSLWTYDVKTIIEVENFICNLLRWHLYIPVDFSM